MKTNVLIIGSGGREHAFSYLISKSNKLGKLYIAPGNSGTSQCGVNVDISPLDFKSISDFILNNNIHLVLVGPEEPLVKGITDYIKSDRRISNVMVIGPNSIGSQLEGSKDFSKKFMTKYQIPTAKSMTFNQDEITQAKSYLQQLKPPYVIKADGLASGKGVVICKSYSEAVEEVTQMLQYKKFGDSSSRIVIEEFLEGIELSMFVICDGKNYLVLPEAKDYKKIGIGDTGPNTGGMGAISPVSFANSEFLERVNTQIISKTINGLKSEGIFYCGFIFIGLMNVNGSPYVIEYNCRMGDPETEAVLPRIKSDLLELLIKTGSGKLNEYNLEISNMVASTIMLVSGGYPGDYKSGYNITGIGENTDKVFYFHAGLKLKDDKIVTSGGRVIAVTTLGSDIKSSLQLSYEKSNNINFKDKYYRTDIGNDLL